MKKKIGGEGMSEELLLKILLREGYITENEYNKMLKDIKN